MIDDYQNKNIDQTLDAVSDWSAVKLQRFLVFERQEKNRAGVVDAITDQLVELEVPEKGYYNGFWFDDDGVHIRKDTPRLRAAIAQTELSER